MRCGRRAPTAMPPRAVARHAPPPAGQHFQASLHGCRGTRGADWISKASSVAERVEWFETARTAGSQQTWGARGVTENRAVISFLCICFSGCCSMEVAAAGACGCGRPGKAACEWVVIDTDLGDDDLPDVTDLFNSLVKDEHKLGGGNAAAAAKTMNAYVHRAAEASLFGELKPDRVRLSNSKKHGHYHTSRSTDVRGSVWPLLSSCQCCGHTLSPPVRLNASTSIHRGRLQQITVLYLDW